MSNQKILYEYAVTLFDEDGKPDSYTNMGYCWADSEIKARQIALIEAASEFDDDEFDPSLAVVLVRTFY